MTVNRIGPRNFSFPWTIFLFALFLRAIPVLLTSSLGIGLDDMFQYDMLARSLAAGNGFRWYAAEDRQLLDPYVHFDLTNPDYDPVLGIETSFRAPLYPIFLSLIYFLVGSGANRFFAARLAQAILGAILAPLTYFIARRLVSPVANDRAAKIPAWTVAAYPVLLVYPIGLVTENLFFPLVLFSFYFLLKVIDQTNVERSAIVAGLFLGLAALTRSVILPFAVVAIFWLWFIVKQKRGAVLAALAFVLTISPWIVRNSLLHHKLTGIETSMGYNLYLGYHPDGNGSFFFGPSLDLLPILDDAERDQVGTQKALEFIQGQPERIPPLAMNRLGFFFGLEKRAFMYFYSNDAFGLIPFPFLLTLFLVMILPFAFVSILSALGVSFLRWTAQVLLLVLLMLCYILPHVLILSEDRFHLILVPFMAILAAQFWTNGFTGLATRWRESRQAKLIIFLSLIAVALLVLNWGLELSREADKLVQLFGPDGNHSYFPY